MTTKELPECFGKIISKGELRKPESKCHSCKVAKECVVSAFRWLKGGK